MPYALPTPTSYVSASWQSHKDRTPPSSEPGTDYGSGYGSKCMAPEAGTITAIKTTNSSATGRYCQMRLNDGRETRALHMAEVWVSVGQRVSKGQQVGLSGASGNGSDWYYGPHCHQTLWPGTAWAAATIDFAKYVGGSTPPPQPTPIPERNEDMRLVRNTNNEGGGVRFYTESGYTKVSNPTDRDLLWHFITDDPGSTVDKMPVYNNMQLDIIAQYIGRTIPPAKVTITDEQVQKLAEAIAADLGELVGATPAQVEEIITAALAQLVLVTSGGS